MKLREIDLNTTLSRPYKKIHLDLTCTESLSSPSEIPAWRVSDPDNYLTLCQKEDRFTINPLYLSQVQNQITPAMRCTLINWTAETSNDLLLKRETFQLSVCIIDKYLSSVKILRKNFQLVGISALFLASKTEEVYSPRVTDFSAASGNSCSMAGILKMERKLLTSLSWRILPATLFSWCTWLMTEWDNYNSEVPFRFKQPSEASYKLYRQVLGILDAALLDHCHLRYRKSALAAAGIYLVLHRESCTGEFSHLLLPCFEVWLECTLKVKKLESLGPAVEYLKQFLGLDILYDLPKAKDLVPRESLVSHYEDFLAYQTYTTEAMPFVKARLLARCKF